jgi:glycosyltransferase involved in cell wall biosynthesis
MKISVVIPCFNAENTIAEQLDALVNQSVKPWEVIISDNGSTDQTCSIVSSYAKCLPNLKIVDASGTKGASHARNVGAKAASGDFLAFCDADDLVSRGWVAALEKAFQSHNFVASRFDYELLNKNPISHVQDEGLQNFRFPFLPFSGGCGIGIRKSIHDSVSGFNENIRFLEDAEYCLRIQTQGEPLTFVPDALIHIRYSSNPNETFINSRIATFRKGYQWGSGMAEVYKIYKKDGMKIYGITPRIPLIFLWCLRFVISGFKCQPLWRIGWHTGVISRLVWSPKPTVPQNQLVTAER